MKRNKQHEPTIQVFVSEKAARAINNTVRIARNKARYRNLIAGFRLKVVESHGTGASR